MDTLGNQGFQVCEPLKMLETLRVNGRHYADVLAANYMQLKIKLFNNIKFKLSSETYILSISMF